MDDNKYTYPDTPVGVSFSEAEKKRWDRNLKKLTTKIDQKFGSLNRRRGRPRIKKQNG